MQGIQSIDQLEKQIQDIIENQKNEFSLSENQKLKPKVNEIIKQLDSILDQQIQKNEKGRAMYLKGKLMDILPEYVKQSEECLSKSLKLNPLNADCWNTLGHILWKKKDYEGAFKCFEGSNEQCGQNKVALRSISIILRQLGSNYTRQENVAKSINIAKEALNLDLNDGESWYVLGNAYMSNFFVNMKTINELQLALKAYNQAEKQLKDQKNPDLHYNRATVSNFIVFKFEKIYNYLEDYELAMTEYKTAGEMDQEFQITDIVKVIHDKVQNIYNLIDSKGKIKQKQLVMMVKNIPSIQTPGQNELYKDYEIVSLAELTEGRNKNKIASCKVTNIITKTNDVPAIFVVVDYKSEFGALSIYNTNVSIYERIGFQTEIYVIDPLVKVIKFTSQEDPSKELSYKCIQIFEVQSLWADSQKIVDIFSPTTVVNETFAIAHPQSTEEEKRK